MSFATYSTTPKARPRLSEERGPRLRELFGIHGKLADEYAKTYPEVNGALALAREGGDDPSIKELVTNLDQLRTDLVLYYKNLLGRTEFLINELAPGAFPTNQDQPLQSIDPDEVFQLGAAIVAFGTTLGLAGVAASAGTGGVAAFGGVPVAAIGATITGLGGTIMAGAAIYGMLYD